MAIPVLNELQQELIRVYVAGSLFAAGDPRLSRYLEPLRQLSAKAPVLGSLADKLEQVLASDQATAPETLMDLGCLLLSIQYTQGDTTNDAQGEPLSDDIASIAQSKVPHSALSHLLNGLDRGQESTVDYDLGHVAHDDQRLFRAYVDCIQRKGTSTSLRDRLEQMIMADVGQQITPFLEDALNLKGDAGDARLLRLIIHFKKADAIPLALDALDSGSTKIQVEAISALQFDSAQEERLLSLTASKKEDIRQAAYTTLTAMGSQRGLDAIIARLDGNDVRDIMDPLVLTSDSAVLEAQYRAIDRWLLDIPAYKSQLEDLTIWVFHHRDIPQDSDILHKVIETCAETMKGEESEWFHSYVGSLADTQSPRDLRTIYDATCRYPALRDYKVWVVPKLFSAQDTYSMCHRDVINEPRLLIDLVTRGYSAWNRHLSWDDDTNRVWDPRWARVALDLGNLHEARILIHASDTSTWKRLIDATAKKIKSGDTGWTVRDIVTAILQDRPDPERNRDTFAKAGFPEQALKQIYDTALEVREMRSGRYTD